MRRQRGIALIQVLLVAGIIGLLMLQIGLTAREQVAHAQALADRSELQLAAQSREAALTYTLLTEPLARIPDSSNPYAAVWNFHGEPFTVDGVTFTIQDESGKMRVPWLDSRGFEAVLLDLDVEPGRAKALGTELMVLQGTTPRRRALGEADTAAEDGTAVPGKFRVQDIGELRLLPGMDEALYQRLRPLLTLYPTPGFNPMTARAELLDAQLTDSQAKGVTEARARNELDQNTLWKLAGSEADETTILIPGPGLSVRLEMELRDRRAVRSSTLSVRPYSAEPLGVWQRVAGDE
jgi:general secretion pathway protein K